MRACIGYGFEESKETVNIAKKETKSMVSLENNKDLVDLPNRYGVNYEGQWGIT